MMRLFALAAATGVAATANHPIAGVITMLKELAVKAKQEGETEALAYTKYSHWCGNEIDSLSASKKKSEETIVGLKESIAGFKAEIESLSDQIAELETELADRAAEQKRANDMRKDENDLYLKNKGDLEATITAIQSALTGLQDSKPAMTQVRALVKKVAVIASSAISHKQHKVIKSFLQQPRTAEEQGHKAADRPDQLAKGDDAAHVADYTFKSGNVIELLKQLEADFKGQLVETEKAETNGVNGHDLATQAQDAAIAAAEESKAAKTAAKDSASTNLGDAESALSQEEQDLATTSKNLKDTTTTCNTFSEEYEKRTAVREGEQTAIKTAIDVLSKATGLRTDKHEIAKRGDASTDFEFLQVSSPKNDAMKKAITLIADAGKRANNGMVQRLAQQLKVMAGRKQMPGSQSPFAQINNMIQKMIFRLNKEQTDEDAHKAWCDTELDKTHTQKDEKTTQVGELTEKVNKLTATIEKTQSRIDDLNDSLSALAKYVKEEQDLRAENKEENLKTIADAKEAQAALRQATAVLTEFYKGSGAISSEAWEDTAFIQAKPADPFAAGEAFQSTGEEKVMQLLQTTTESYQSLQSETEIAEAEEQSNFEADMNDKRTQKSQLEEDVRQNEMKKKRKTEENNKTKKQLKSAKKQLEAINQYLVDLDPSCVTGTAEGGYEERKAARASEVGALKEALETLKTAFEKDVAFVQKSFMARRA